MSKKTYKSASDAQKSNASRLSRALFSTKDINGVRTAKLKATGDGRVMRAMRALMRTITMTKVGFFGWIALVSGLVAIVSELVGFYILASGALDLVEIIIGGVLVLLATVLLIFNIPLGELLQKFPLTDFILFEFFSMTRPASSEDARPIHHLFGLIFGAASGVCVYFFSVKPVIAVIFALVFLFTSLVSPELPILFSLLAVPYFSLVPKFEIVIVLLALLSFISFSFKVLGGKRVYSLEFNDILILTFLTLIFVSSLVDGSYESKRTAAIIIAVVFSYFPFSNMMVNRRLAITAVNVIIVSALPIALSAIAEYVYAFVRNTHAPSQSLFSSPAELCAFLCAAAMLAAMFAFDRSSTAVRIAYTVFFFIFAAAIISTECVPLLVVLVLLIPAALVVRSISVPREIIGFLAVLPNVIFFLPSSVLTRISSLSTAIPDLAGMQKDLMSALILCKDRLLFGYGADGMDGVVPEVNTYVWILFSFGVFASAFFVITFLFRMRRLTLHSVYRSSSNVSNFISMGTLAAFSIAALGCFYDLFSSPAVLCIFFASLGVSTASIRISKRDHDDRLNYYGDQSSENTAAVDILVRK